VGMAVIVVLVVAVSVGMKSLTGVPGRLYSFQSRDGQGSLPAPAGPGFPGSRRLLPAKATRGVLQP
jgi:hypothetical protein